MSSLDEINKILNLIFSYEKPWVYFIFLIILWLNVLQDKMSTGKYLGMNGFLLTFNMVLYFSLLHIVFSFSVKEKPVIMTDTIKKLSEKQQIEIEIKDPIPSKDQKDGKVLEKAYLISMMILVIIFCIYLFLYLTRYIKIESGDLKKIQIGGFLILLTVCSEIYLIFHVFDNPVTPLCDAILKGITSPKL